MRILLIESDDHTRHTLCNFLDAQGYDVISTKNGNDALLSFRHDPASVVILDLLLADFDPFKLLGIIKSEHPEAEVIATSDTLSLDSVATCMQLGTFDYLIKDEEILNSLDQALKRSEAHQLGRNHEKEEITALQNKISALEEANNQLSLYLYDQQTGLHNQGLFEEKMLAEIERGKRNNRTFSILLIRLDPNLDVNDNNSGLQANADRLPTLAQSLRERLRKSDILAQYDNQTLSIILPETDRNGATLVAQSITALCASLTKSITGDQPPLQTILQIGIASFPEDGTEDTELFDMADSRSTFIGSKSIH
jgi:two-component system cell cycle response regulator